MHRVLRLLDVHTLQYLLALYSLAFEFLINFVGYREHFQRNHGPKHHDTPAATSHSV
jgi:hypothetical protein